MNQPMNQPNDPEDLGSMPQNMDGRPGEADEQDWWVAENDLGRKQFRSRVFQGTNAEDPEKPRKRGKAHNRRGQNDQGD